MRCVRLWYNNLKESENYLDKEWQSQIWMPPLIFSNTAGNSPILADDSLTIQIIKEGEAVSFPSSSLHECSYYDGKENNLYVRVKHQLDFHCDFELSNFPFDVQKCGINIALPEQLYQSIVMRSGTVKYSGTMYIHTIRALAITAAIIIFSHVGFSLMFGGIPLKSRGYYSSAVIIQSGYC